VKKSSVEIGDSFGEMNHLEVLNIFLKNKSTKYCIVKCHICCKDQELYGNGEFEIAASSLKSGHIPCACSNTYSKTKEQCSIVIKRLCEEKNYDFIGYKNNDVKVRAKDKIILKCLKDGHVWDSTSVTCFIKNKNGCPKCKIAIKANSWRMSDEDFTNKLLSKGLFSDGWKFKRREETYNVSGRCLWDVICPICSCDELVTSGKCSGIFKSTTSNLRKGRKPCRCPSPAGFHREKSAVVYVLKIVGSFEFTGYGISNKFIQRLAEHRKNLKDVGCIVDELITFEMGGNTAFEIERKLKKTFVLHPQKISGFKTEATYYHNYLDVIEFIEKQLILEEMNEKL
jgi:hypothetical protein